MRYRWRAQKHSAARLVTGKRFFSPNGRTIEKAQTFDAEEFTDGIVGVQLIEEPAEAETPQAKKTGARRKAEAA